MKQLWFNGEHYYVATCFDELSQLVGELTGEPAQPHEWETVPSTFPVTLLEENNARTTLSAGEWARQNTPGRLGGVDY